MCYLFLPNKYITYYLTYLKSFGGGDLKEGKTKINRIKQTQQRVTLFTWWFILLVTKGAAPVYSNSSFVYSREQQFI